MLRCRLSVLLRGWPLSADLPRPVLPRLSASFFSASPARKTAADAREAGPLMVAPMLLLAAGCIAVGLLGFCIVPAMSGVVSGILGFNAGRELKTAGGSLGSITVGSMALLLLVALLAWLRRFLLSGREVGSTVTWDCGYSAPTAAHAVQRIVVRPAHYGSFQDCSTNRKAPASARSSISPARHLLKHIPGYRL